jgi:hypothetical protein
MAFRCFFSFLILGSVILGCDDGPTTPPRDPMNIFVGLENTFLEALDLAAAGDTIVIQVSVTLESGVEIPKDKTPLVIRGDRKDILFRGPGNGTLLSFRDPKNGTRISNLQFSLGGRFIRASGKGSIRIEGCRFTGGDTQVRIEDEVTATLSLCEMTDPTLFNVDAEGEARIIALQNTMYGAGDCGVRLLDFTRMHAEQNNINDYANYGIACVTGTLLAESRCNNVYDSDTTTNNPEQSSEPYLGCEPAEGDISKNPKFCDPESRIFLLFDTSPCAEANSGDCGQIGANPVGCLSL